MERDNRNRCIILISLIVIIYLIDNISIFPFKNSLAYYYLGKPVIWSIIAFVVFFFPRKAPEGKLRHKNTIMWWSIYLAIIYIVVQFLGGLIDGFGKSPYNHSPIGVVSNIFSLGTNILAREMVRSFFVNSLLQKRKITGMTFITVFFTVSSFPIGRIFSIKQGLDLIIFISEITLPELALNVLATYLVAIGGQALSMPYLYLIQLATVVTPLLPNLKWITRAFTGSVTPIFSLMVVQHIYTKLSKEVSHRRIKKENPIEWAVVGVFSILVVWFVVGVFPIYPSVIVTGSMKPMIEPGDMVIVRKADYTQVKKDDIVQFKKGSIFIFHRIIDVMDDEKTVKFQTKGDNNSMPDSEPVEANEIKGKVVKVIPKIGWPSLIFKDRNKIERNTVEF